MGLTSSQVIAKEWPDCPLEIIGHVIMPFLNRNTLQVIDCGNVHLKEVWISEADIDSRWFIPGVTTEEYRITAISAEYGGVDYVSIEDLRTGKKRAYEFEKQISMVLWKLSDSLVEVRSRTDIATRYDKILIKILI